MSSLSKDIKDHITLKFGGLVSLLVEIREKIGKPAVAFQSSPGDILFDLPEDQMEGVVVGEATNDKEKKIVANSIGASNEEVKKPENEHNDEKQDDQPVCVSNEEFKQPHDIHVVEQQADRLFCVGNEEFKQPEDRHDESKAIIPYIGSGSECKLVEFTPIVSKREPKPEAQLKSPYINIFGSSEPVQEPKKKCAAKRKVKGLYPFKTDLLAEVDSNIDTKFNDYFEKGFKLDNKRKIFTDDANLLEKSFDFAIDTISHKMWWFRLLYSGECLRSNHIDIYFYYMRKEIKYSGKIKLKVTTSDSSLDQNLQDLSKVHDKKSYEAMKPYSVLLPHFLTLVGFFEGRKDFNFCSGNYKDKQPTDPFEVVLVSDFPKQTHCDCDVFLIVFAMFIIRGMTHKIPRDLDIDWYRNKICVKLYYHALKKQLEDYESESEGLSRRLKHKNNR
ncbi:hypothetical protein PanWU01x14_044210 [Parasponia andersonii]|uniref:Ulp1 protease family, C-terminal catalytic domain containing protein n=1 Tax=Parasponia andersonii TaxID=3476 RepID=A0A2P5DP58_PARAD|nr:hypothetical protein PanWU01x14_044210 [Parasponia andersonii]